MALLSIPTEPIASIPRPLQLLDAIAAKGANAPEIAPLYDEAIADTIQQFEATPDGEQRKYHNFWILMSALLLRRLFLVFAAG